MGYSLVQNYGSTHNRLKALYVLGIPFGPDLPALPDSELEPGCKFFLTTDSTTYTFDGTTWALETHPTNWGLIGGTVTDQTDLVDYIAGIIDGLDSDDIDEGATNKYFTQARVLATVLTGLASNNSAILATDTILEAFGKCQGQIAGINTSLGDYLQKSGGTMTGFISLHADPTNAMHPVTKSYLENFINGITWKQEVVAATTANITTSGLSTVDGVALSDGDRVLVKNQTSSKYNGIYIASSGDWVRSADADTTAELVTATVLVRLGTVNANTQWTNTNTNTPVLGTDPITFAQISAASTYTNGTYLSLAGNVFDIDFSTFSTTQISEGTKLFFTNARAIAATLTGYAAGAGTITSADTVLQAIQKLDGNIQALSIPVKATAAELNTGTNDTKFATPLAMENSKYVNQTDTKNYATAAGTNTYTASLTPAIAAYTEGLPIRVKFTNANTAAATININSLGAVNIYKDGGSPVVAGDIIAGTIYHLVYNGTNFQLIGSSASATTSGSAGVGDLIFLSLNYR